MPRRFRICGVVRAVAAALLIAAIGLAILPCGFVVSPPAAAGERGGNDAVLTALQVCDHGDPLLGVLFDLPLLIPGAPVLVPSPESRSRLPSTGAFVPDGFHPAIDHPPQLSA